MSAAEAFPQSEPQLEQQEQAKRHLTLVHSVDQENQNLLEANSQIPAEKVVVESGSKDFSEIADLVKIDVNGRGHISSNKESGRSRSGQFTSNYEMEQIAANQDLIRDGLNSRVRQPEESPVVEIPPSPSINPPTNNRPPLPPIETGPPRGGGGSEDLPSAFMREFPEDMARELAEALNDWTELAAIRESSVITLKSSEVSKEGVEEARLRYEELRQQAKAWTLNKMEELDIEPADRVMISKLEDLTEVRIAGLGIKLDSELLAEPKGFAAETRKKFYEWWSRQGGGKFFSRKRIVGNARKAAVMGIVGLPVGIAAGAAGVFLAGPLAGAAVAAGLGRGVTRGLMRSHIEKNIDSKSIAEAKYEQRLAAQQGKIEEAYNQGENNDNIPALMSVTSEYAKGTEKDVQRNRRRVIGSVAIGALTGAGGAYVGELAHNALMGSGHNITDKQPKVHHSGSRVGIHGRTGQEFNVPKGGGEISEIQAYAASHNYHVSPEQADRIYNELYAEHGSDIIKLEGSGPSTYVIRPGDVGLSHPGEARWYPGIENELRARLSKLSTK